MKGKNILLLAMAAAVTFSYPECFIAGKNIDSMSCITVKAEEAEITHIDLFAMDSNYEEKLTIPEELFQQYQITSDSEDVRYRIKKGKSVTVSADGLIEPYKETWYWKNGFGTTSYMEDAEVRIEYTYGDSIVTVIEDDKETDISVSVINYARYYAESVMDDYIAENITDDMTTEEKLNKIAAFPASYDYSPYYSSAVGMIVSGEGGDCWASTDAIIKMAEKIGFEAWSRNGNRDSGAGSGHMNAMIYDGEKYYEAEAGYSGKAPRPYNVTERKSLYCTRSITVDDVKGLEIYQYDGKTFPESLEIPSEIGDTPVISIGASFIVAKNEVKEVIIPPTVINIGDWAFSGCEGITEIELPESVKYIGSGSFNLPNIENIKGNSKLVFSDGILYDVETDMLVSIPNAESAVIPESCKTIGNGAAYYNANLKEITIGDSVEAINEGAFYNCTSLETVRIGENVKSVGQFAFYRCGALKKIYISSPDCVFDDYLLSESFDGTIYGYENSTAQEYAEQNNKNFVLIDSVPPEDEKIVGDIDNDGAFTVLDIALLKKYLLCGEEIENIEAADLSGDGQPDVFDLIIMKSLKLR